MQHTLQLMKLSGMQCNSGVRVLTLHKHVMQRSTGVWFANSNTWDHFPLRELERSLIKCCTVGLLCTARDNIMPASHTEKQSARVVLYLSQASACREHSLGVGETVADRCVLLGRQLATVACTERHVGAVHSRGSSTAGYLGGNAFGLKSTAAIPSAAYPTENSAPPVSALIWFNTVDCRCWNSAKLP